GVRPLYLAETQHGLISILSLPDALPIFARRKLVILAAMTAALCLSFAIDLAWGPARYGLDEVVAALLDPSSVSDQVRTVVWDIQIGRASCREGVWLSRVAGGRRG